MDSHAAFDAALDGVRLVLGKVVAGLGAQQGKNLLQGAFDLCCRKSAWQRGFAKGVGGVGDKLGRHLRRQQFIVHKAGGNGVVGHAVVLGGIGVLGHGHAAFALDGPHALGAIAARAREDDADSPLALVLGKGAEEKVDGQTLPPGSGGLQQLQGAVMEGHVAPWRDDVGTVGFDHHPVLDFEDLHPGVALDEVGKDAFVVRGQVLHQDKSHAGVGVGRHAGKKGFKGRQSPGRGTDADDGETGSGSF